MSIYSAKWVLPVDGSPIPDGEVVVEDDTIVEVRPQRVPERARRDFGDAVIMPGFVNAHTHVEYTALRGFLEDVAFFPWIRTLTDLKSRFNYSDWIVSGKLGALELIACGITTIGDNTDAGVTFQIGCESGLRAVVYQEAFGIDESERVSDTINFLESKVSRNLKYCSNRVEVGISPHAPYTIRPELFAALARHTQEKNLRTSIHVAETQAESDLIERGEGPFAELFNRRGITWTIPAVSPTQYVYNQQALNHSSLAVHCVHQSPEDILLLRDSGSAVVHCPKSNAKLGAGIAPLSQWLRTEGLRIALGTDSAVSNNSPDFFEEMRCAVFMQRALTQDVESVTAKQILRIATLGGSESIGLQNAVGSLTVGKKADLIAVRLDGAHVTPATDPYCALVYSCRASDVCFTMANGQVLYDDGVWKTLDDAAIRQDSRAIRKKVMNN